MTPVKNYVENKFGKVIEKEVKEEKKEIISKNEYDFSSVMDYFEKRDENFIVGIISMNQNKLISESNDIFKIRPQLQKSDSKKRGTGIYSLTGAVCATSKDKDFLLKVINKLKKLVNNISSNVDIENSLGTRENMCNYIMKLLLFLEKYSTSKDDNKITYVMVPADHKVYSFPYNMEDRIKYVIKQITELIDRDFDYVVKKERNGTFEKIKGLVNYNIEVKASKYIDTHRKEMEKMGFKLDNKLYVLTIN
jgi:hypothetical protein